MSKTKKAKNLKIINEWSIGSPCTEKSYYTEKSWRHGFVLIEANGTVNDIKIL